MPDRARASRAAAVALLALLVAAALAPSAQSLGVSTKAIRVVGSQEYTDNVQTYSGQVQGFTGEFDGSGIAIAVLDTGVDDAHPTFEGAFVAGAEVQSPCLDDDCMTDQASDGGKYNPDDMNGHGTHVASIALGRGCCGDGPRGVAPGAKLVDVKISDSLSGMSAGGIERGIDWVIAYNKGETPYEIPDKPVRVISLSFASSEPWTEKELNGAMKAISRATKAGILVVVAAGNCGPGGGSVSMDCPTTNQRGSNTITSPGASPDALTVGAIDDGDSVLRNEHEVAPYSSRGPNPAATSEDTKWRKPDVVAPGSGIVAACANTSPGPDAQRSTRMNCEKSGTSMATPHVAGIAAILFQAGKISSQPERFTPEHVKSLITSTAEDWSLDGAEDDGWDKDTGYGYVDAYKALVKAINLPPQSKFTFQPSRPIVGQEVTFDPALSQDPDEQDTIERYHWQIPEEGIDIEVTAGDALLRHTFEEPGAYTVQLTATDSRGTPDPEPHVRTVQIDPPPPEDPGENPTAILHYWPERPIAGQPVHFDASNSSDPDGDAIIRYDWDFDHETQRFEAERQSGKPTAAWTFEQHGPHEIALRVVDESGLVGIHRMTLNVLPPPPAPPVVEFTNPQEGDTVEAGPFLAAWHVLENPAKKFTVLLNTIEEATVSGEQVRLELRPGEHTLKLIAEGPGGTSTAWVNFTALEGQSAQGNTTDAGNNSTDTGDNSTSDEHDHSTHDHDDEPPDEDEVLDPASLQDQPPVAEASEETNDAPIPWIATLAAILGVALARRRRSSGP